MVLEAAFQTADMRRHEFPWRSAKRLASSCILAGLLLTFAVIVWQMRDAVQSAYVLGIVVMLVVSAWRHFHKSVLAWQAQFGRDVEYVARRVREHEAGLRFEGP